MNWYQLFREFIIAKPNLDSGIYAGYSQLYKREQAQILKDRNKALLELSKITEWDNSLILDCMRSVWQGRLELVNGELEYTPGQYKSTEYRACAYAVLKRYNELQGDK